MREKARQPRLIAAAASRDDERLSGEYCQHCGLEFTIGYRPDPCLGGYIPGVAHACCGHGRAASAYVCGWAGCQPDEEMTRKRRRDFWELRGQKAVRWLAEHRLDQS